MVSTDIRDLPEGEMLPTFPLSIRPLRAMTAGVRLLLNKEDTKQMLVIFDSIDGPQNERNFIRYSNTETGRRMIEDGVDFSDLLLDAEWLRSFEEGTLGHAYRRFTDGENINAGDLAIAEQRAQARMLKVEPNRRRYIASGIALHDVWHVLTGFGRDALGEACVLAFTAEQVKTNGIGLFASALAVREQIMFPRIPVLKCVAEARALARRAAWLPEQDWRDVFTWPLPEARSRLKIGEPVTYNRYAKYVAEIDVSRRARLHHV